MSHQVDLTGKKFGKLTGEKLLSSSRGGSRQWLCVCDCGNRHNVTTRHLNRKNNNIKSCGCLKEVNGKDHKDWKGCGDISGNWWRNHVLRENSQTARVKVAVTITIDEAWTLFMEQDRKCKLSGLTLRFGNSSHNNTSSLDRIDSSKGYIKGNIQWVHKHINFMKRNYENDYFIDMCKLVAKHNK